MTLTARFFRSFTPPTPSAVAAVQSLPAALHFPSLAEPVAVTSHRTLGDRVAVPTFMATKTPTDADPFVPAPYSEPVWPNLGVIRGHLLNGTGGDVQLEDTATGKSTKYRTRLVKTGRSQPFLAVDVWKEYTCAVSSYSYMGDIDSNNDEFVYVRGGVTEADPTTALFARWYDNLLVDIATPGIVVTNNSTRAEAKKLATLKRVAAEMLAARIARIEGLADVEILAGRPIPSEKAVLAIHACLKRLQYLDEDMAAKNNKRGYSKGDCADGHYLANLETISVRQAMMARRMIQKYERQLDTPMLASAMDLVDVRLPNH